MHNENITTTLSAAPRNAEPSAPGTPRVSGDGRLPGELDAELQRLWGEYLAQAPVTLAAHDAYRRVRAALDVECPAYLDGGDRGRYRHDVEDLRRKLGVNDAFAALRDADEKLLVIVQVIHSTPAKTLLGIGIKLAARYDEWDEIDTENAVAHAIAEVNRLTGASLRIGPGDERDDPMSGAAYVTAYEGLRIQVLASLDPATGRPVDLLLREPKQPHNEAERQRRSELDERIAADAAWRQKMVDFCIRTGRTSPAPLVDPRDERTGVPPATQ